MLTGSHEVSNTIFLFYHQPVVLIGPGGMVSDVGSYSYRVSAAAQVIWLMSGEIVLI